MTAEGRPRDKAPSTAVTDSRYKKSKNEASEFFQIPSGGGEGVEAEMNEKNDEYAEVEVQNSQATIITDACIAWQYLGTNGIHMSDFLESQNK